MKIKFLHPGGEESAENENQEHEELEEHEEEGEDEEQEERVKVDESKWDPGTKAYIKKLRDEAASNRVRARDLEREFLGVRSKIGEAFGEEEEDPPEVQMEVLANQTEQLSFQNAVLAMAIESNIPADGIAYFNYLVARAVDDLDEGDELDEEQLQQIIDEARSKSSRTGYKTSIATGHDNQKFGAPGSISLEQFRTMGTLEKSQLYQKNPDLYNKLVSEAKAKKVLV